MSVITPRAPRLRLHRETVRRLSHRLGEARLDTDPCIESRQCDYTFGCTWNCGPSYNTLC